MGEMKAKVVLGKRDFPVVHEDWKNYQVYWYN